MVDYLFVGESGGGLSTQVSVCLIECVSISDVAQVAVSFKMCLIRTNYYLTISHQGWREYQQIHVVTETKSR